MFPVPLSPLSTPQPRCSAHDADAEAKKNVFLFLRARCGQGMQLRKAEHFFSLSFFFAQYVASASTTTLPPLQWSRAQDAGIFAIEKRWQLEFLNAMSC